MYKTISCHNYNNSSTIVYGCDIRKAQNFLRNCQNYAKAYFMMYSPTGYQELKTFDGVWKLTSVKQKCASKFVFISGSLPVGKI